MADIMPLEHAAIAPRATRRRVPMRWRLVPWALLAPAVLAVAALVGYPIVVITVESFFDVNPTTHAGWTFIGLRNFETALADPEVRTALLRSLMWTVGSVVLQLAVAMVAALLVRETLGKRLLRAVLVLPWATPAVVGAVAWKLLYQPQYGLANDILAMVGLHDLQHAWLSDPHVALGAVVVANVWRGFPFLMVMLLSGMAAISDDLYEAAAVSGASIWQQHRYVTLPMVRPVILMSSLMSLIWTFNNFSLIYVMTGGGPAGSTNILTTLVYQNAFSDFQFGYASALSVILFAILAAASTLYIKAYGKESGL
jgi:multiple sugar transport system permease protein